VIRIRRGYVRAPVRNGNPLALWKSKFDLDARLCVNLTGINVEVAPKRLVLLHGLLLAARAKAVLVNRDNPRRSGVIVNH
jgi:hypothetical protein